MAEVFIPLPEEEVSTEEDKQIEEELSENCGIEFASDIVRTRLVFFLKNWENFSYKNSLGCGIFAKSPFIHGKLFCTASFLSKLNRSKEKKVKFFKNN